MTDLVLTIRQPWAGAIFAPRGPKNVENRTWKTKYRGRLWIHAGSRDDINAPPWVWAMVGGRGRVTHSAFIGYVTLADCVYNSGINSRWADDDRWHWLLRDPVPLARPITWTGQLALWPLPEELRRIYDAQPHQ